MKPLQRLGEKENGGERGIRTLGTGYYQYDGLANRCFRPLSHLSAQDGEKVGEGMGWSQCGIRGGARPRGAPLDPGKIRLTEITEPTQWNFISSVNLRALCEKRTGAFPGARRLFQFCPA